MIDKQEIGRRIADRRKALRMTQEELGTLVSRGPTAISKWESGENGVSAEDLPVLGKALRVPVQYFLDDHESENPNTEEWPQELKQAMFFTRKLAPDLQRHVYGLWLTQAEAHAEIFLRREQLIAEAQQLEAKILDKKNELEGL